MELPAYLKVMADKGASNLYLSTGARVMLKIEVKTGPVTQKPLPPGAVMDLSMHLKAVVAQRLLKGKDGKRAAAVELMLASPYIKDLINKGEHDGIGEIMEKSPEQRIKTFDQAILELYHQGKIAQEEALANADSRHNLEVKIRLEHDNPDSGSSQFSIDQS